MTRLASLVPSASAACGLAALLVAVPVAVLAASSTSSGQEPGEEVAEEPVVQDSELKEVVHEDAGHEELEESMETLKEGMRHLRRNLTDPAMRAQNLDVVRGMQKASLNALWHCPDPLEPVDEAGEVAWEVNFKRAQLSVTDHLLRMELAIVEARTDDARALYAALRDLKSKGHETYDPEE